MNKTTAVEKRNFGFPRKTFREIITNAVCGTTRKSLKYTHYIDLPRGVIPSQILGCSVTELRLHDPEVKDTNTKSLTIGAKGIYEAHVWYAYNNGKETDVLRYPVKFEESLPLEDYDCQHTGTLDAKITVSKCPAVVESAITEDHRIKLETEMEISIEVVGETKLLVQVYVPGRGEVDEGDED